MAGVALNPLISLCGRQRRVCNSWPFDSARRSLAGVNIYALASILTAPSESHPRKGNVNRSNSSSLSEWSIGRSNASSLWVVGFGRGSWGPKLCVAVGKLCPPHVSTAVLKPRKKHGGDTARSNISWIRLLAQLEPSRTPDVTPELKKMVAEGVLEESGSHSVDRLAQGGERVAA
jgi:hypothetical protein